MERIDRARDRASRSAELGELFAALTIVEAHALHRRLSNHSDGDAVAVLFSRLSGDRRGRLLAFLADARRREAMKSRRAGLAG